MQVNISYMKYLDYCAITKPHVALPIFDIIIQSSYLYNLWGDFSDANNIWDLKVALPSGFRTYKLFLLG